MNTLATAERASSAQRPDRDVVGALLASLPPLTNVQRQAFRGQHSVAACDAASARVQAAAVHDEALAWLPLIERALIEAPLLVRRYGRARFAWLLECVRDLGDSLEMAGNGAPSDRVGHVLRTAKRVREDLLEALGVLVTGDDDERAALELAAGTTESTDALGASLRALARLADDWIDREAPLARALVASVDLSAADVEAARAAGHAVACGAHHDPHGDPPAVERAEGRVLLEMALVRRIFERAHGVDARVPLLVPGPATQAALAG
jgi:hypothetical protein